MRRKMTRAGFTLAETLIVVMIMGFLTAAGTVLISRILGERTGMIQTADAEVVGSTLLETVAKELRFGQDIELGDYADGAYHSATLDSTEYGGDVRLELVETVTDTGSYTEVTIGGYPVLSRSAYSRLQVSRLELRAEPDSPQVEILVAIGNSRGELWSGGFSVIPLNGCRLGAIPETDED